MSMTCIPLAEGVPGYIDQPPNWLGTALPFPHHPKLNDPRWAGAVSHTFSDLGTGAEAAFRALYHTHGGQTSLYLSWRVRYDPELNNGLDRLYVGFVTATGENLIIRVVAYDDSSADSEAGPVGGGIQAMRRNADGTATTLEDLGETEPDWINLNTRAWLVPNAGLIDPSDPTAGTFCSWAIQMRVPIHSIDSDLGLNLDNTFKMWSSIHVHTSGGVVEHNWPPGPAYEIYTDPTTLQDIYPDPTTWGDFHLSSGPSDPVCPSGGISLDKDYVGTTNIPSSNIEYSTTSPKPENIFYAKPRNDMGVNIDPGSIQAKFRISNWGSGWWEDPGSWDAIAEGVTNSGTIPDGTLASDTQDIRFPWTVPDFDPAADHPITTDDFESGAKSKSQCMLVELSSTGVMELRFLNDSVWRNMDFVEASRFVRPAQISVEGLDVMPKTVYVAVEKSNMPRRVSVWDWVLRRRSLRRKISRERLVQSQLVGRGKDLVLDIRAGRTNLGVQELVKFIAVEGVPLEELETVIPTYRVHVYHDSGRRITVNEVSYPILRAQSSYGYYVVHGGSLEGWGFGFEGVDVIEQISPDFFRLEMPDTGVTLVTSSIMAAEASGINRLAWGIADAVDPLINVVVDNIVPIFSRVWIGARRGLNRVRNRR